MLSEGIDPKLSHSKSPAYTWVHSSIANQGVHDVIRHSTYFVHHRNSTSNIHFVHNVV